MKLLPTILKGPYRLIELFERHLEKQVPISKKLKFRLEYILIRKHLSVEFDIELHVILSLYNRTKVFMSEPNIVKKEFEMHANMFGIDKVRFFLPTEDRNNFLKKNLEKITIHQRVSIEYFAHLTKF